MADKKKRNEQYERERERLKEGIESGGQIVSVLLDAARKGGLGGLNNTVVKLTDNQAKWALTALVYYINQRNREFAHALLDNELAHLDDQTKH